MSASPHRKTVVASGLLCCALILVVLFTSPSAFRSPAAIVVMGLIGTAAVLLQLQMHHDAHASAPRIPLLLNVLGIVFAAGALFPSPIHGGPKMVETMALAAVGSFAVSSAITLHSLRKQSSKPQ